MSYTNMIVELEEAVEKSVAQAIRDADIADLVTNVLDHTNIVRSAIMMELDSENVLTRGNFDPSDYDVLNVDEVEYKIKEEIDYLLEEKMSDENASLLARIEKLEEQALATQRLLGHAADVITYLTSFQKEKTDEQDA